VLRTHTHLIPSQPNGTLEAALNLSMDEILGSKAEESRVLIRTNRRRACAVMPTAESTVLWLRNNLPEQAEHIVSRVRQHYHSEIAGA
jgi:hypothetical protein